MGKGVGSCRGWAAVSTGLRALSRHTSRGPTQSPFCDSGIVSQKARDCRGCALSLSKWVPGWGAGQGVCGDVTLCGPLGSVPMTPMLSAPAQSLFACPNGTTAL